MTDDWITDKYGGYEWRANLERGRDRMHGWTFETYPVDEPAQRRARDAVLAWLRDGEPAPPAQGLYIYGPPGVGKTGLAYPLAREWIAEIGGVVFENVRELLGRQRARFARGEPMALDHLLDTYDDELVVLDDLGAGKQTEFAVETVALIVERLHAGARHVVVTTNYAPSALARRLGRDDPVAGKRIVSRLLEDALQIRIDRRNLRTRNARRVG